MKLSRISISRHWQPVLASIALAGTLLGSVPAQAADVPASSNVPSPVINADGVIRIRSAYGVDATVMRLKTAIAAKGIRFFDAIDQAQLGKDAGLTVRKSTLVLFGNPPLGVQFLQANAYAGLDWPVRMLVVEEADGSVWLAWTDFGYIANRYHINNRAEQFKMASEVAGSLAVEAAR